MGTHPSGPSVLAADPTTTLAAWLSTHAAAVGAPTASAFGPGALPFLFKVLSVHTALSIQSHPDKELAGRLHAEKPALYPDANHKPEMAIAVGPSFSAMAGFAPVAAIAARLAAAPEVVGVVGEARVAALRTAAAAGADGDASVRNALRGAFTALMTADEGEVGAAVDALAARLDAEGGAATLAAPDALAQTLAAQYPRDVGVLASYFLNYVKLADGEALALGANVPHAYVSGNLVECMAASDNVIRAGLTPKPRDTDALCASLTYASGPPPSVERTPLQRHVSRYDPGFAEFEVLQINLPAAADTLLPPLAGPALLLVSSGAGTLAAPDSPLGPDPALDPARDAARGDVLLLPAGTPRRAAAGGGGLVVWVATVNAATVGGDAALYPPAAAPAVVAA